MEEFRQVTAVTNSTVSFGQIPREDWLQPDWIDEEKAKAGRDSLVKQGIIYGGGSLLGGTSLTASQSLIFLQIVYRTRSPTPIGGPKPADHFIRYRNMCRFQSRAFYKQELVLPYRWYWRVE